MKPCQWHRGWCGKTGCNNHQNHHHQQSLHNLIVSQIKNKKCFVLILIFIYSDIYHYVSQWCGYLLQIFQSLNRKKKEPNRHLLVQSPQRKHHSNERNLFKVNNKDTRATSLIRHWRPSDVFIVNFDQILHIILAFSLLILTN